MLDVDDDDDDDDCLDVHDNSDHPNIDMDFFDYDPSKREKLEMRKAVKPPSEWLNLLCRAWANENPILVATTDAKFLDYKPYLKGLLSSQLLCRLSIPSQIHNTSSSMKTDDGAITNTSIDFWEILGINDAFDRSYIVAQIERFCSLYSIRAITLEDISDDIFATDDPDAIVQAVVAGTNVSPNITATSGNSGIVSLPSYMDATATAAAVAAATTVNMSKFTKKQSLVIHKASKAAANAEQALVEERRQNYRREQRRISHERKEQKHREKEEHATRKAAERACRETEREERRRRKLQLREERERFAQEQKEAAMKRAAELVASNRVPIEITRGVAAAKAAQLAIQAGSLGQPPMIYPTSTPTKKRSAVIVSTARDLQQIVIHSRNLWAKYNAIAKEHNQKVNWITVAREIGIHVKVREKYARMYSRAEQRGFDWVNHGHWNIKDHPEIFLEPTQDEQKAKMPPPPPDSRNTVLVDDGNKEIMVLPTTDDAALAACAAAAVVVDASVSFHTQQQHTTTTTTTTTVTDHEAAQMAAALVGDDPIVVGSYDVNETDDDTTRFIESV